MMGFLAMVLACDTPEVAEAPAEPAAEVEKAVEAPPEAEAAAEAVARVNLNTATEDELKAIPGITPKLVHEFEEYRPYISIQQFRKEIGKYVDAETVTAFEPHVFVPIDPNTCDEPTLLQIAGLDAEGAKVLVGKRPFADATAFQTALAERLDEAQATSAMAMVTGF